MSIATAASDYQMVATVDSSSVSATIHLSVVAGTTSLRQESGYQTPGADRNPPGMFPSPMHKVES